MIHLLEDAHVTYVPAGDLLDHTRDPLLLVIGRDLPPEDLKWLEDISDVV